MRRLVFSYAEAGMISVAAGIIRRGSRYLAAQRPASGTMAGLWEFPGGKIEAGENPAAALQRELEEELGITVLEASEWRVHDHQYPDKRVRLHFFHIHAFIGEPEGKEGQLLAWVSPSEARELPFLEADLEMVGELAKTTALC